MNGHIMESHTDTARSCEAMQIPRETVADVHERAGSELAVKPSPLLHARADAKVATQPTTADRPGEEDPVPRLGPIPARRPPAPQILPARSHAEARRPRSSGEGTARELRAMASSRLPNTLDPTAYRSLLHLSPCTHGEQERSRLCCRRGQIREGSHRRLSTDAPRSSLVLAMDPEDHLIGASDLPPPGPCQHTRVVPWAATQQSWRCGASDPSMQSVLVPSHASMVPAEPP